MNLNTMMRSVFLMCSCNKHALTKHEMKRRKRRTNVAENTRRLSGTRNHVKSAICFLCEAGDTTAFNGTKLVGGALRYGHHIAKFASRNNNVKALCKFSTRQTVRDEMEILGSKTLRTRLYLPNSGVRLWLQPRRFGPGLFRICACLGLLTSVYSWFVRGPSTYPG